MMQRNPTNNLVDSRNRDVSWSSESAAAERLDASGRLAAWIAHQINNPLGAISGSAQLLARRLQRDVGDPEALRAYLGYLETIQSHTERCARITAEALNFTQSGDPDLHKVDALEAVTDAVELVRYAHPESEISLAAESDDLPDVRADREWLTRVVFEVLSNAVSASEDGPIRIEIQALRERVRIAVADSGPGIPDEVLPRVFDPFFSTRDEARGLGLTLSLDMMRKMNGSLGIVKSGGDGAIFAVEIPVWGRHKS